MATVLASLEHVNDLRPEALEAARRRADWLILHHAWSGFLNRVEWNYFATLTADPRQHPRTGHEWWYRRFWGWLYAWLEDGAISQGLAHRDEDGQLRGPWANAWRHGRGRPWYALAMEPHRDDRLHAHALIKLTRGVEWLSYKRGHELWRCGHAWLERPRSQKDVGEYIAKYVTKECVGRGELILSPDLNIAKLPADGSAALDEKCHTVALDVVAMASS